MRLIRGNHREVRGAVGPRIAALRQLVALSLLSLSFGASAGPEGGQVVGGTGTIDQNGALTQINQASNALAIDWTSFDVAAGEVVQFVQPGADAIALNRVVGNNASEIYGRIDANGTVFLVNTAGVLFSEGSQVNVGNLVVSGLDMSVEDFMEGNYELAADGLPGAVINRGTIAAATGGSVVLVGGQVVNSGLIRANYGRVTLAGAERGFVDFDGTGLLRFEVTGELKQKLDGAEAAVTNSGVIEAQGGEVIMAASAARGIFDTLVNNEGVIEAGSISTEGGVVRLVADGGNVVNSGTIDVSSVDGPAGTVTMSAVDGKVVNTGSIRAVSQHAAAGEVRLTATNGNVELTGGEIVATSVEDVGGTVVMESNADTLITAGLVDVGSTQATGGTIHVLGERVAVVGPSRLGSAGGAGGGTILIGGSYQGRNPLVRNASQTIIGSDVVIDASAINSGSGGTVIVWSDDYTWFYGTVSARGPPTGHGGFVEVSSHGTLAFVGRVDLRGGTTGTLLLDPTDIRICVSGAGCVSDLANSGGNPATFSDANNNGPSPSTLTTTDLQTQLGLSNVIVTTASSFGDAGNITVEGAITWAGGNSLTLTANNNITVNAGITASGAGSLTMTGGSSGVISVNAGISLNGGTLTASAGAITTTATGTIAVGAGNISLTAEEIDFGGAVSGTGTLLLQPLNAATSIGIGGGAGTLDLSTVDLGLLADGFSGITIGRADGTGGITVSAATFTDPLTLRSPSGGTITVNGALAGTGNASVTLTGNTVLNAGITTADQNITITGDVSVGDTLSVTVTTGAAGGGSISITGTTNGDAATGAAETLTLVAGTGTIGLTGAVGGTTPLNLVLQSNDATSTGTVTFTGAVNAIGLTTFGQGYAVVFNGGGTFANAVSFLNTAGVTLGNDGADSFTFNGGLTSTASTTSLFGTLATSNDAITLGAVTLTGAASVNTGTAALSIGGIAMGANALTLTGDEIELTGAADSITGSGAITLAPATAAQAIDIGGAGGSGALDLTATELATIQDGHSSITIGHAAGTGGITIAAITFNDSVTLRSPTGGTIAVNGTLTGAGNASITLDGSGATTVLAADIVTADQDITISDSVVVAEGATVTVSTGTGGGGNISITGTVDGTAAGADESLQLISGSGTIGITGVVGGTTPLDLTLQSDDAGNTGAVTFNGAVNALSLTTFARGYGVALLDGGTITDAVSFLNTAGVALGSASSDTTTFNGGLTSTAGTTTIAGTVATSDDGITLGSVVLAADSTLTSGSGAIVTGSVTDGASAFDLTLQDNTAGSTGSVTLGGSVTIDGLVTFGQAYSVALHGAANSFDSQVTFLNTGTTTLGNESTDASTFNAGVSATAGAVNLAGTVATTDDALDLGAVTLTADGTVRSGSGAITIGSVTGAFDLTLQDNTAGSTGGVTFTGNVTIDDLITFGQAYAVSLHGASNSFTSQVTFLNTGTTTLGNEATDSSTFGAGLTANAGAVNVAGTVATSDDALTLGAVTLTTDATLDTNATTTAGDLSIGAVTGGNNALTLETGGVAGADLTGSSITGITTLTLQNIGGTASFTGSVGVTTLTVAGTVNNMSLTGGATVTNAVTFANTGTLTLGDGAGDAFTFTGGVTATAPSSLSLAGAFSTTNQAISFGDGGTPTTLTADSSFSAGTGTVTFDDISGSTFSLTISADEIDFTGGANSVTGSGAIVLQGGAAATTVGVAGGAGDLDLSTTDLDAIADGHSAITIGRTDGTGLVTVSTYAFKDPVTIRAGGATGDITVSGALSTTDAGITINAGRDLVISGSVAAGAPGTGNSRTGGSVAITAGGAVTLNGAVSTAAISITDIVNANNATTGSISITAGGAVTGNASGTITTGAASTDGTGGGETATSGSITISAGGALTLAAADAIKTGNASTTTNGNDNTAAGSITISAAAVSSNGTNGQLDISVGTASGGTANTAGTVAVTTTGGAGDAGGIFLTSGEALRFGAIATAAGSSQNITITGAGITLTDVAHTVTNDVISLNAGTGTLSIANTNNDLNVGSGNLSLRGDEIELTGGNNSIIGTGTITLSTGQAGTAVVIAGTPAGGQLDLTATEIAALADGFSLITIGRADSTAALTVSGAVTFNDNLALTAGSVAFGNTLTGGTGLGITINAVAGSITSTSGTTRNLNAFPTVSLIATGSIGGADTFEVHAVTTLSIDAGASFAVEGDGSTLLTNLTLRVNPADAADTWALSAFSGLTLTTGDLSDTGNDVLVDGIVWAPAGTNALNITIIAVTGNILLEDQQGTGEIAINLGADGGNITLTTLGAGADIFDNATATADDPADTNFANLVTTDGSTITFNAAGDVGAAGGNGDIDVNGTGDIVCNSGNSVCQISTNVSLTGVSVTVDPVNDVVDINVTSGALSYIINESCLDANTCIILFERGDGDPNTTEAVTDFDFSLTSSTGDIYIAENAIFDIGAGDVTLTATLGGIYEITNGTVTEIRTTGVITLNAATGIGTQHLSAVTGGSVVVAASPVDLAGTTLGATATTGAIRLNELDSITITTITASAGAVFLSAGDLVDDGAATAISGTSVSLTATGAIGAAANEIDTTTSVLVIDAGTTYNVANTSDLGTLTITAGAGIGATSDVTATNLTFTVSSDATDTTLTNVSDTSGLDFTYTLRAGDLIVNTIDVGSGAVTLAANTVAGQEILDDEAALNSTTRITGGVVTLTARGGIGSATTDIDTAATSLVLSVTEAGVINIDELDAATLTSATTFNGAITVVAAGALTATSVVSSTDADTNDISLTGAGIAVGTVNAGATAGDVTLDATTGAITDGNGAGTLNVTAHDLSATGATGIDLDTSVVTLATNSSGANGNQALREANGLTELSLNAGTGDISLTAGGVVAQVAGVITADELALLGASASYTLGTATNDVNTIAADTGALTFVDADGLTVGSTGGETGITSTGAVSLTAGGDDSVLTISDAISATSATLVADEMTIAASVNVGGGSLAIRPFNANEAIDLGTNSGSANTLELIDAELDFLTAGTLQIGDLNTGDISITAPIDLTATPTVTDLALVTGGNLLNPAGGSLAVDSLSATADSIGTGAFPLVIAVNDLTTDTSAANGNQFIVEANGLSDLALNAGAGNIALVLTAGGVTDTAADGVDVTAGALILTLSDGTAQAVGASGNAIETSVASLAVDTSAGGGDQYLSEASGLTDLNLDAGTGDVELTLTLGGIADTAADAEDVIAASATLTLLDAAAQDIGATGAAGNIETSVDALTVDTSAGNGSQYLTEANGLTDLSLNAGTGNVELTLTLGGVTDTAADGADITATNGTLILSDGSAQNVGALANAIETSVNGLTVTTSAGNGSQFLAEANGLTDLSLNAGTGTVSLTLAAGGIVDTAADGVDVTGNEIILASAAGIGQAANAIETSANYITASSTSGDINLANASAGVNNNPDAPGIFLVEINSITTSNGNITFAQTGGASLLVDLAQTTGSGDITISRDGAAGGGMAFLVGTAVGTLNATLTGTGGGLLIGNLTAGTAVNLTSLEEINENNGDVAGIAADAAADITAPTTTLIVGTGIGTGSGGAVEISVDTLNVTGAGTNPVNITELNGLTDMAVGVGSGAFNLVLNAGGIVDTDGAALDLTAGNASITLLGAGDVGALANALETSVDGLTINTSAANGSQYVTEANGLTNLNLNAGAGNVVLALTLGGIADMLADATDITAASASLTLLDATAQNVGAAGAAGNIETDVDSLTVDTSTGNGSQFLNEADGLADLSLNAGTGDVTLSLTLGGIVDTDGAAVDITANDAALTLLGAGDVGALANPLETSVDTLSINTATNNGSQFVTESNGLTDLELFAGTGTVTLLVSAGDILDNAIDGVDVSAAALSLATPAGAIGASGNTIETANVGNLSLAVLNGFFVSGDGVTNLTDLAVTIDSGAQATATNSSYVLTGFANLADWGTGRGLYDGCCLSGTEVTIYDITATTALNLSITNLSGDIYLTDQSATGRAAIALTSGGNITITAANGSIYDYQPTNFGAPSDDSPFTDYNLLTTGAYTVSLNAPGNAIGAAGDGDIDVNGTGNLAINAEFSSVSTSVALTSLDLTFDPVNDVVSFSLSGATIVSIDEACFGVDNVCINTVSNSNFDLDLAITAISGDIFLDQFSIHGIGAGDVSLTATDGGIFALGGTSAHIGTNGTITLTAASGNSFAGESIGTAAQAIDVMWEIDTCGGTACAFGVQEPIDLVLNRTNDGNISISSFFTTSTVELNGFSSIGGGSTTLTVRSDLSIGTDLVQDGDITLEAISAFTGSDDVVVRSGFTVGSTAGDIVIRAADNVILASGSTLETTDVAGTITLFADTDNNGNGRIDLASATVTSAATSADAITLRASDFVADAASSISATGVGGGIRLFTPAGTSFMEIGGTCGIGGFCMSDTEFGTLTDFDLLTVGEAGVQANVILFTATSPVADGDIVVNATGNIFLIDAAAGPALQSVSGDITLNTGAGGITTLTPLYGLNLTNGVADLLTSGAISLNSSGGIGSFGSRIEFAAGQDEVSIGNSPSGAFLAGLGDLGLGTVATGGGQLDVLLADGFTLTTASTVNTGAGNITLTASEIDLLGGAGSVTSTGILTLQPVSTTFAIDLGSTGDVGSSLSLTDTDLAALADGFSSILIGRSDGQHVITVVDATFTDPVTLRAPLGAGGIVDDVNDAVTDLTAPSLTFTVGTGGVGQGAGGSLDIEVTTLNGSSAGAVSINEATSVALGLISAAGQTVTLSAGNAITDGNAALPNVNASLLDISAVNGIDVDTTIAFLTASNTTAGGINVADSDGFAVNTISAPAQTVTLNGGTGAITDNNGVATNVTASLLNVTAATGINLDTAIDFLTASNTTSGGIDISDADDLGLNSVTAATQAITLASATGAITDNNGAATNVTGASAVLSAVTGIGSGDAIELSVTNVAASNTTSGDIELTQPAGNLTIGVGGSGVTNAGGDIVLTTVTGSLHIDENINSGAGRTTLAAGNQITADGVSVTTAAELVLSAVNGISPGCGGGGCFLTDADSIQATNVNNGLEINNTGDVVLADITGLGYAIQNTNGGLNFQNIGSVTVADAITTGRRVSISAFLGATADLTINADITGGTTGSFFNSLYADGDIVQAAGTLIDAGAGFVQLQSGDGSISVGGISAAQDVYLYAFNGAILDNNAAATNVSSNYLEMYADTGIDIDTAVSFVFADNATSGDIDIAEADGFAVNAIGAVGQLVTLDGGTGAITDNNGAGTNVTAGTLDITATTGINLDTAIDFLTASNTTSGGIDIADTNGLAVNTVTAAGQNVTLNAGSGALTDNNAGATNVTAGLFTATAATGIDLDTAVDFLTASNTTSGGIDIADTDGFAANTIGASGQTVTLNGGTGAITDNNGAATNVTANLLDVTATTGIDLDTAIALLTAANTTSGGVNISDTDGFAVNTVTAAAQVVTLNGGTGGVTDNNGIATNVTAGLLDVTAATGISLDTAVDFLTASNTTSGGIDIAEADGFALNTVSAAGQTVTLNGGTGNIGDNNGAATNVTATTLVATAATGIDVDTAISFLTASNTTSGGINVTDTDGFALNTVDAAAQTVTLNGGTGAITDNNGAATNVTASLLDVTATTGISTDTAVDFLTASNTTSGGIDIADADGFAVNTVAAAGQTVSLNGGTGAITDNNGGATNVSAQLFIANATTGINLDTAVAFLVAGNTTSGGIDIADTDGMALGLVTAAGQTVTLNGGTGGVTDANGATNNVTATLLDVTAATGIDLDTTIVELTASNTTSGGINVADADGFALNTVSAAGQVVTLNAGTGAITDNNGAAVNVTATLLDATATTGIDTDTAVSLLTASNATSGGINVADTDGFALNTVSAAGQTVTLNGGTGAIADNNAAATNVTAGTLDATAATGIDVDTDIAFLTASNTVSGGVNVADTNGFAVNTVSAAGQTVTLNGGTGAITDNNAAAVNVVADTLSAVAAVGIDLDTTVAFLNGSTTGIGNVSFDETDGVEVTSFTTANGSFTLNTGGNTILTSVVSTTSSDANDITVTAATGNLSVGTVNAGGAGGDVTLTATTGSLLNNGSAVTGDVVTLAAQSAVGASGSRITTTAGTLNAQTTGAGAIWLNETDGVVLGSITAADGLIDIVTGGNTTITSVISSTDSDANDITILATAGDILVDLVDTDVADDGASGDVTITAAAGSINDAAPNPNLNLDVRGDVLTLTGATGVGGTDALELDGNTLNIDGGTGGIGINDLNGGDVVLALASAGNISYGTNGNIYVDQVLAGGTVTLISFGGSINDHADDLTTDIVGTTVTLTAFHEIGGNALNVLVPVTDALEGLEIESDSLDLTAGVNATTLATFAGVAGIVVRDIGGTTLSDLDTVNGDITLVSDSTVAVGDVFAGTTTLSDVVLDAASFSDAGAGDIVADLLTVDAAGAITLSTDVNSLDAATSAAGAITVTEADDIALVNVNAFSGPVSVSTPGSIAVTAVSAAGQTVTLAAGNAITDANAGAVNVSASLLDASAANGISLDTAVDFVTASNSTTGGIDIADADGFAVNTISALAQTVTLNGGTGAITDNNAGSTNITATLLDATAATGIDLDTDIGELTASNTTSGGINIADTNGFVVNTVSAAGQTVTLNGGTGGIGDNNGAATNVTAALFDVTAATGINLDTAVTLLTASNSTSGGIDIADTDGFGANTILASGQLVTLNGGTGAITDNNGAANNVTATLLTATATTGIDLDTTIGALTATNTTSGGINVSDVDGFLVNSVTAAGQTVTLNGGTGALSDGNGVATNVTASLLDATATTGIDLDTDVAFLTASNATVGGINVGDVDGFAVNTITAAGQLVTLNGGTGAVTDNNGATTNVSALALSVTATAGIDLDTSVDVLGAANTTSGGINISDVNGFGLSVAVAPLQTVTLNGGTGAITDDNGAATNVTAGTLDITAATGIDVDTAIDVLTASNTTSGGINIADTNGFALNTVSAAGQTVTLNGGTGAITDNNAAATNVTASLFIAIASTGIDADTAITELTALNTTSGGINIADTDGFAVNSVGAAGQTVTLNGGTGGITDNNGATTNVTAALLDATATTGISLDTAINELTALNTAAGGIDVADTDGFLVNTVSAAGQTVTLNAGTGGLGDNNGVATNVTADQFTATAPAGIDLDTAVNTLTFTSGGAVNISELDAVALAGASTANTLLLTATSITDGTDGDLTVTNNAGFNAPTITLGNDSGNDTNFGSLTFTSTGAVSIAEDSPTQLTGTSSADSLTLTSNGAITQAAASSLNVTTLTTLNALNNNNITLDQNNDFGTVSITGANLVVLNDTDGDASAANDGLDLGNVTVGSLTATTVGALTDSGNLVAGVAVFSGSSITLGDNGENTNFGTLNFDSDGAVDIELDLGVTLAGNNRAGGDLTLVAANGAISDGSGATLDVTGQTTLSAVGNDIQLDNVGHTLSTVAILDAVDVALRTSDGDGIILGGMAISGNLGVTADQGDITGSGALVIGGASTFTANGAGSSIIVDDAGNNFTGSVSFGGTGLTTVSVVDTSSLDIAGANLAGDLTVVAAGITTSGAIVVDGTATFDAGSGNNLVLLQAGNDFEELEIISAFDVDVLDIDDIELGDITTAGYLDVQATSVTNTGDLSIAGTTTIVANGDILLDGLNNDFVGAVDISSALGNVTINDVNNLSVLNIDGNDVTVTALGTVTESVPDAGTPDIRGTDDIVAGGSLTITAASIGSATDPLELDAGGPIALTADNIYADFFGDLTFSTLTVAGVTGAVELTARVITVDADFNPGLAPTDVVLVARGIIVGGGGTVTADTLRLDALNLVAFGGDNNDSSSVIGSLAAPILLNMASGADYQVPTLNGGTLNGFGFISASNFTGTDFTTIFNDSNNRVFLIANFTDLIASVQGSFITAQIFTIDSSQFRADLNIYGIDGAGLLLPHDQCEDEESADCAKQ